MLESRCNESNCVFSRHRSYFKRKGIILKMKKVLVTGGCGYIGSHTIIDLINNDFEVISVDNNSNSDLRSLNGIHEITGQRVKNYTVDLCDYEKTCWLLFD